MKPPSTQPPHRGDQNRDTPHTIQTPSHAPSNTPPERQHSNAPDRRKTVSAVNGSRNVPLHGLLVWQGKDSSRVRVVACGGGGEMDGGRASGKMEGRRGWERLQPADDGVGDDVDHDRGRRNYVVLHQNFSSMGVYYSTGCSRHLRSWSHRSGSWSCLHCQSVTVGDYGVRLALFLLPLQTPDRPFPS